MVHQLPRYVPEAGASALSRRLRALLDAGAPVRCTVYIGLAEPGPCSARHARVTHAIAAAFAAGAADAVPRFNTNPPPALRVTGAASLGRPDALGSDMAAFPADLASPLWLGVAEATGAPADLSPHARLVGVDLLLRLGYPRRAAALLGLDETAAPPTRFDPFFATRQLAVLYRRSHDVPALVGLALDAARDPRLPVPTRLSMAIFVVAYHGRRGLDTPSLHRAVELGRIALEQYPRDSFRYELSRQTYHRAVAFVPFLRGDHAGALAVLDQALDAQHAAKPATAFEELAWADHCFPLYETLSKTRLAAGDVDQAVAATDKLVELSPGDHRTWTARGKAFHAAGRVEEAWEAYQRMFELGGLPAAAAAYHRGWTEERLGRPGAARRSYETSLRIDPTAPVVAERLAALGVPEVAGG